MNCPGEAVLFDLLDGDLPSVEDDAVRAHIDSCERCSRLLAEVSALEGLLADDAPDLEPAGLVTRIRAIPDRFPREAAVVRCARHAGPVLAAAALLLALHLVLTSPAGSERSTRIPLTPVLVGSDEVALVPEPAQVEVEEALVSLHRIARGRDGDAARSAIARLEKLGRRESLPALTAAADMPDRRDQAVRALAALGDPRALPTLERLLPAGDVGDLVLDAIATIGGGEAAAVLIRRISSEGHDEKLVAALARVGGISGTRTLIGLLDREDADDPVRREIAAHAGSLLPHLVAVAGARDLDASERALDLLGEIGSPSAVPALADLLAKRDRRVAAARALARIDSPGAAKALVARYRSPEVREAFRHAGTGIEAWLIERLETGDMSVRLETADLLGHCGGREAVIALHPLARDRALAPKVLDSLGRIGGEWGVAALDILAEDPKLTRGAIAALGVTGAPEAVPVIAAHAASDGSLREAAVKALGRIACAESVEAIVSLDGPRRLRNGAVRALAAMDRALVVPVLETMLASDPASGARGALDAIGAAPPAGEGRWSSLY